MIVEDFSKYFDMLKRLAIPITNEGTMFESDEYWYFIGYKVSTEIESVCKIKKRAP